MDEAIDLGGFCEALEKGETLGEVRGMEESLAANLRDLATARYGAGDIEGALGLFRYLCVHRHDDADLWVCLARCAIGAGEGELASLSYGAALGLRWDEELAPEAVRELAGLGMQEEARGFALWGLGRAEEMGEEGDALGKEMGRLAWGLGLTKQGGE